MSASATSLSRAEARRQRRQARALASRRRALSPRRILLRLAGIPMLAATVGLSLYLRSSPWPPPTALAHLIALGGCAAAAKVHLAPAYRGGPGYHPRNDPDGDGVACDRPAAAVPGDGAAPPAGGPALRQAGGAKFVRP